MIPRQPIAVISDMRHVGVKAPEGAEYLGARIEHGGRILIWRVGETVVEQPCQHRNVNVTARRRAMHIVKETE